MEKKTLVFQYTDKLNNPLIDVKRNGLVGWQIGNLTILSKKRSNRIRNIIVEELKLKKVVFGSKK